MRKLQRLLICAIFFSTFSLNGQTRFEPGLLVGLRSKYLSEFDKFPTNFEVKPMSILNCSNEGAQALEDKELHVRLKPEADSRLIGETGAGKVMTSV